MFCGALVRRVRSATDRTGPEKYDEAKGGLSKKAVERLQTGGKTQKRESRGKADADIPSPDRREEGDHQKVRKSSVTYPKITVAKCAFRKVVRKILRVALKTMKFKIGSRGLMAGKKEISPPDTGVRNVDKA